MISASPAAFDRFTYAEDSRFLDHSQDLASQNMSSRGRGGTHQSNNINTRSHNPQSPDADSTPTQSTFQQNRQSSSSSGSFDFTDLEGELNQLAARSGFRRPSLDSNASVIPDDGSLLPTDADALRTQGEVTQARRLAREPRVQTPDSQDILPTYSQRSSAAPSYRTDTPSPQGYATLASPASQRRTSTTSSASRELPSRQQNQSVDIVARLRERNLQPGQTVRVGQQFYRIATDGTPRPIPDPQANARR